MDVVIDGRRAHASTGGPAFDPAKPAVVFVHGAGMDRSVWSLQTRWFAHHGYSALAVDLPGHGRSEGPPLPTIDAMADWTIEVLAACGAPRASWVGHSMGSLVALSAAARHGARVERLALIGTTAAMAVGQELRDAAAADSFDAIAMVNLWGHGARAGLGHAETPGAWMAGGGQRLLERAAPGVLSNDLVACNGYDVAGAAKRVGQATLILQGARDMMTAPKGARALAAMLPDARLQEFAGAGHMLMVEEGGAVLSALAQFIAR